MAHNARIDPDASPQSNVTSVPLLNIQRQYAALESEINAAILRVCASGRFALGPDCDELEERLAAYCGTKHAVACASGSDALLLALMALDIGPGDEVIVPSFTFFATASAVTRVGARPVFVDIDPVSFNLDPARLESALSPSTKALLPVHLYGQCAEMDVMADFARAHDLVVIEDAAQAIGATFQGRRAGSMGEMGCLSFYPTKNLGAFGDGGLLTTSRDDLAEKLRLLRVHGMAPRYYHQVIGINSRLDSIQAAVLNVKLAHLDAWNARRVELANRYAEQFAARGLERMLTLPETGPGQGHVWNQYVVRVLGGHRDALRAHLAAGQVASEIYYPVPLHQQQCFAYLGHALGDLPVTEQAAHETLALPMYPELTMAEQDLVVERIASFFNARPLAGGHGIPRPKHLSNAAAATRAAVQRDDRRR